MNIEKRLKEIKDELKELKAQKEEQRNRKIEIRETLTEDLEADLDQIKDELDKIEEQLEEIEEKIEELEEEKEELEEKLRKARKLDDEDDEEEMRRIFKPNNLEERKMEVNKYETLEYRKAFMDYVLKGRPIPEEYRATTMTSDVSAVIPTHLMSQIIEKLKFYGNIFNRVTHTNFQGGVEIPVASAKPQAEWVAEGNVAGKQKKEVTGKVIFAYHKLQVRVAITLEAATTTLAVFEQTLVDNIYEAMIVAIEDAIINGDGNGKPLGILNANIPASRKITVKPDEIGSWEKWSKIFAKVPLRKRNGISLILNNETFEGNILGAVDANGQPIARVNYGLNGQESYSLRGKEVVPVEDYLPAFDDAQEGEVFGIIMNLKDYMINSNLQMTYRKYFDEDTDEWIHKSTVILDGKPVDTQGIILLVKGASA